MYLSSLPRLMMEIRKMIDRKIILAAAAGLLPAAALAAGQKRPNVVFYMMEDLSRESFNIYNGHSAPAPNFEALAAHGVLFNNAYSCAPVSSAARSSLITGCYAPSLGLSWHRKIEAVTLPEGMHLFPYYLRQAGYHTTNCSKTDYNCLMEDGAWDNAKGKPGAWRKRPDPSQPFFSCITNNCCHESSLQFPEEEIGTVPTIFDPADVVLHPMHPDTKTFRYTYARHYDAIRKVDEGLGEVVDMLREDGLLDDTFIVAFGDNGGCIPGTKAYTCDLGLRVPMVVYVPANFKKLCCMEAGSECDAVVSFLDLAPTLLNLAGVEIPSYMDGQPFLGRDVEWTDLSCMDETVCYGDRFDELYACNRVVRKQDFKYSRNFYPCHPRSVMGYYRMRAPAFREWYRLYEEGALNEQQRRFFEPQGPEELYLLSSDIEETRDLASDPHYAQVLSKMRGILDAKMLSEVDLGIIPETFWVESVSDIEGYKASIRDRYEGYLRLANIVRKPWSEAAPEVKKALRSGDEIERFWALMACCWYGEKALSQKGQVMKIIASGTPILRSKAAVYATMNLGYKPSDTFNDAIDAARNSAEALFILNDAAFLRTVLPSLEMNIGMRESLSDIHGKKRTEFINAVK